MKFSPKPPRNRIPPTKPEAELVQDQIDTCMIDATDYTTNHGIISTLIILLRKPYSGYPEIFNEEEFGEAASNVQYDESKTWRNRVRVAGDDGPAVLLVHGFGSFLDHYRDNIHVLVGAGNRVWSITVLGFGKSEKPNVV